ncbi:MAG: hypothetical protein J6W84_02805 [Bacteroidales bacterium]|nr:hypothetical protein [Bacteroidales bacterium]
MKRYLLKLQKYKKGANGTTQYKFSTKIKAVIFAAGYQAALHDVGKTDLYISVWETDGEFPGKPFHPVKCISRSDDLLEVARREY